MVFLLRFSMVSPVKGETNHEKKLQIIKRQQWIKGETKIQIELDTNF